MANPKMFARIRCVCRVILLATIFQMLGSCGGGSGASGSLVTFEPAILDTLALSGESATYIFSVKPNISVLTGDVYAVLFDDRGVVEPDFRLSSGWDGTFRATFHIAKTLPEGTHTGSLRIQLCRDPACASIYPGSPVSLPYNILILPSVPTMSLAVALPPVTQMVGEPGTLKMTVSPASRFPRPYYFAVADTDGAMAVALTNVRNLEGGAELTVTLPAGLPVGESDRSLTVHLCVDAACTRFASLTPFVVPYRLRVVADQRPPLVGGAPDWETTQGNYARSGYVPLTVDPARISRRWLWQGPNATTTQPSRGLVTMNGKALVLSEATTDNPQARLVAIDEASGDEAWRIDLPNTYIGSPLSASAGHVYFLDVDSTPRTWLASHAIADGSNNYRVAYDAVRSVTGAPVVSNGKIFAGYERSGGNGGVVIFSAGTGGAEYYRNFGYPTGGNFAAALLGNVAYAGSSTSIFGFDITSNSQIAYVQNIPHGMTNSFPVVGSSDSLLFLSRTRESFSYGYTTTNYLMRYGVSAASITWTLEGRFESTPVVHDGVFYISNNETRRIEARSEADGTLLWHWSPHPGVSRFAGISNGNGNLVLTDNVLFFCADGVTWGLDLASREVVFNHEHAGRLAVSANGILYVASPGDRVAAFNLR